MHEAAAPSAAPVTGCKTHHVLLHKGPGGWGRIHSVWATHHRFKTAFSTSAFAAAASASPTTAVTAASAAAASDLPPLLPPPLLLPLPLFFSMLLSPLLLLPLPLLFLMLLSPLPLPLFPPQCYCHCYLCCKPFADCRTACPFPTTHPAEP